MKRHLLLPFALLVALACLALAGQAGAAGGPINAKHFFWAQGNPSAPDPTAIQNDLIYHGGNVGPGAPGVLTKPIAYVVYWGTEWQNRFQIPDTNGTLYPSNQLKAYVNDYLANIGGSPYANIQTQYCSGVMAGATSCPAGSTGFIGNPRQQFGGSWVDPSPVPSDIVTLGLAENMVDDPLAAEAVRAADHFGSWNPNALYIILTPPEPIGTGQPAYCGYHSQTQSVDGIGNPTRIQYAFIPWQNTSWPGLGQGCGQHNVNATSNAFGNGIFDSWSIVIGHEYEEAVTDPDNFFGVQDGWNDDQTSENGDKCAWHDTQNITLGKHYYAVQPLWSNAAFDATGNGCVVAG